MSSDGEFRRYAEEALRWASEAKTEKEKQALTDLAYMWMQAALIASRQRPRSTT